MQWKEFVMFFVCIECLCTLPCFAFARKRKARCESTESFFKSKDQASLTTSQLLRKNEELPEMLLYRMFVNQVLACIAES